MIPGAEEVLALLELRAARAVAASGTWSSSTARRPPRPCGCSRCPRRSGWYMTARLPGRAPRGQGAAAGADAGRPACRCRRTTSSTPSSGCTPSSTRCAPLLTGPRRQRAAGAHPRGGGAGRGAARATRRCRSSATASTASSPTGSSPTGAPTRGGAGWVAAQAEVLEQVAESFAGLAGVALGVPRGRAGRARRAARPRGRGCTTTATRSRPAHPCRRAAADHPDQRRRRAAAARCRSSPQDDVDLARNGDELVVPVASYRRLLTLPAGLARHRVAGARVRRRASCR